MKPTEKFKLAFQAMAISAFLFSGQSLKAQTCGSATNSPLTEINCRYNPGPYTWNEHPLDVISRLNSMGQGDAGDKDFFNQNRKRSLFVNGKRNDKGGFMIKHEWTDASSIKRYTVNPNEWGVDFAVDVDGDCDYEREDALLQWATTQNFDELILYNVSRILEDGTKDVESVDSNHTEYTSQNIWTGIGNAPNEMGEIETFEWHLARFLYKAKTVHHLDLVVDVSKSIAFPPSDTTTPGDTVADVEDDLKDKFYNHHVNYGGDDVPPEIVKLSTLCKNEEQVPPGFSLTGKKGNSTQGGGDEVPTYRPYDGDHLIFPKDDQGRISHIDKMITDIYNLFVFKYRWINGYIQSQNATSSTCSTTMPTNPNCGTTFDAMLLEYEWWDKPSGMSDSVFNPDNELQIAIDMQRYARCLQDMLFAECDFPVYTVADEFGDSAWIDSNRANPNITQTTQGRANRVDQHFDRIYLYSYHKNPCDCYNGRNSSHFSKFQNKIKLLRDNNFGSLPGNETEVYPVFHGGYYDDIIYNDTAAYPQAGCDGANHCNYCSDYSGRFFNDLNAQTTMSPKMGYVENIFQDQYNYDTANTGPHPNYGQNHINGYCWFKSMMIEEHGVSGKQDLTASKEAGKERSNRVYPNPAKDQLQFDIVNPQSKVMIYTIEGKLMEETRGDQKQLDISGYPSGMYFVSVIEPNDTIETFKIVKK
jgi:hypothetical protein